MTTDADSLQSIPSPRQLRELYEGGANISRTLQELGVPAGERVIETAYDLQSGTYSESVADPANAAQKLAYSKEFGRIVSDLGTFESLLKAGVGEAITLSGLLEQLPYEVPTVRGFDLCWSRVAYGRRFLEQRGLMGVELCTGSLSAVPFLDDSFEVVCTSHSVEPNGGREEAILRELYRVASRYLVLLEPSYEMATDEGKARMESLGYCTGLLETAERLGFDVVEHRPIENVINPLNPTHLIVVRKGAEPTSQAFACPQYRAPLLPFDDGLFSPEALAMYPVIGRIPCLRVEHQVVASHYPTLHASGALG